MKAVPRVGDIRVEDVPDPTIQEPSDAIVRLTASAICGTDLHMVRGTLPGMKPARSWVTKASVWWKRSDPPFATYDAAIVSWWRQRSHAATARTVETATNHSATTPIRMGHAQALRSSAVHQKADRFTACRQSTRAYRSRIPGSSTAGVGE